MGDVLLFNPETEFQVLEEFEFDETIQRPEAIRFFTLGEQTTDLFQKLLPKTGKLSKKNIKDTQYEVDTFKKLYDQLISETPTGFEEVPVFRPKSLPWVSYYNSHPPGKTTYTWNEKWIPLFSDDAGLAVNYYPRLLDSLPKSGIYYPDGDQNVVYPAKVNNTIALPDFVYTKTAYKEDGTFRVQKVPRVDTHDVATFTGYTIDVQDPQPPAPLEGHPFLGARTEPITIETTEDLPTILPDIESIFTHAVPRTSNPYKDTSKYLKLYDIKLSQVPWSVWRESFPPVELVDTGAPPVDIPLRESAADAPAKVLLDVYKSSWYPGLSVRKWLSTQLDGGTLVSKILLSQAGALGPIAIPPPVTLPEAPPIEGTPEDCLPTEITDFEDFASRGVYRTPKCAVCGFYGHGASTCPDRKGVPKAEYAPGYGCIPLAIVAAQREEEPYKNKLPWVPGTETSILQEYQKQISTYTERVTEIIEKPPEAEPVKPPSETRQFVVAILEDENRLAEDKVADIRVLLAEANNTLDNHVYKDAETGQFLLCEHTLEQYDGTYEKDASAYLRKWSVADSGFRVCQFCGERIVDILEDQDQFDENGRVIQRKSKAVVQTYLPDEHLTFAQSLKKLQQLFNLDSPADDIFYLLLSLLQILPDEEQLKPVLDYVKGESAKVQAKIAGKKLTAKQQSDINLALAVFGFNGVVILLQTHRPQLLPRRSFGNKPLVMRGFPRDTDDASDTPLVDSLLGALAQTFESYPTTFKGSSVVLLRNILNDKKSVKKVLLSSLTKQFVPVFKSKLQKAKTALEKVDVAYTPTNTFEPPVIRPKNDLTFLSPDAQLIDKQTRYRCKETIPWLTASTPFSFRQESIEVTAPIQPSTKAVEVPQPEEPAPPYAPPVAEIREKIKRKVPDIKSLKKILELESPEMLRTVLLEWMTLLGAASTATDGLRGYIRSTRPLVERAYGEGPLLRDYFKSILIEFGTLISEDDTLVAELDRSSVESLTIRSLFTKAEEARKTADALRAREREEFKERMRRLPDAQREITKMLIDYGLAPYLITKSDREQFLREYQEQIEQADQVQPDAEAVAPEDEIAPQDLPDEGVNVERDVGPQGEEPEVDGVEQQYDYGDYGDARARNADGEEYNENRPFDDDANYGF